MQVSETLNEGLKREIKVVVPAADMKAKLDARLADLKNRVKLNGFRQGKVPIAHLRKLYGKSAMSEIVQETIDEQARKVLEDRNEKSAQRPQIKMTEDEKEAEIILAGEADFEFSIAYEALPEITITDLTKLKIERPVVEIDEKEVAEQVERIAENARTFETKKGKAAKGDQITFDYLGKIDGEAFEGGADNDAKLVLGSGNFIPGFEDGLAGMKAGDTGVVKVTFPEDYNAAHLAGKDAEFDVTIKEVGKPGELELNDELAKTLGLESMEQLNNVVRDQIVSQYGSQTRQKVKRQLLDMLDEMHTFELPESMVDQEFDNIWAQITNDLEQAGKSFEDEDTTEEEARAEYRTLAERRVRLGLVLAEIGSKAKVEVTEPELQQALYQHVQQYPGQEQEVFEFFKSNADALGSLRAPIFEEKVVDHIIGIADVTDKTVSKEELMKDDVEEMVKADAKAKAEKKKAPASKKAEKKDK